VLGVGGYPFSPLLIGGVKHDEWVCGTSSAVILYIVTKLQIMELIKTQMRETILERTLEICVIIAVNI
jgi:hypothetical protein